MTNVTSLNHYGHQALEHWRRHRPEDLATLQDPESYFQTLGERIAEAVEELTLQVVASQPQASGFAARLRVEQEARSTAETEVLAAMAFTEPGTPTSLPTNDAEDDPAGL